MKKLLLVCTMFFVGQMAFAQAWQGKGDQKMDYEAEMIADYDHKELSEDGFNPKHTL